MRRSKLKGRPRKSAKVRDPMDIRAGTPRRPCGEIVQMKDPGPHERHLEIKKILGYGAKEDCEISNVLFQVSWITDIQRDAGLQFQRDWSSWTKSASAPAFPNGIDLNRSGGQSPSEETEQDVSIKKRYDGAMDALKNAGAAVQSQLVGIVLYGNYPRLNKQRVDTKCGLDALAKFYGLTT